MSERNEAADVLRYARDVVLSDESKWCKGGAVIDRGTHRAYCALGTMWHDDLLRFSFSARVVAEEVLDDASGLPFLGEGKLRPAARFNDDPDTTFSDVIDLFDRAIKSLEEPGDEEPA